MEIRTVRDTISRDELTEIAKQQFGDMVKVGGKELTRCRITFESSRWTLADVDAAEQLANVGSEVGRARRWEEKDPELM